MINFSEINRVALTVLPSLLDRWTPGGRYHGSEYTTLNPKRNDRSLGSFRINVRTGRWADFSTNDAGGDPVSLAAYLFNLSQVEAALRLAAMLGLSDKEYRWTHKTRSSPFS